MKTNTPAYLVLTLVAILTLFTDHARAATVVLTDSFNLSHSGSVTVDGTLLGSTSANNTVTANQSLNFAQFNSSLGTLTSVNLVVTTTGGTFDAAVSGTLLNLLSSYTMNQTESYSLLLSHSAASNSAVLNATGTQLLGGSPINVVTTTPSLSDNVTFNTALQLGDFIGLGNYNVNLASSDYYQVGVPLGLNDATLSGSGDYIGSVTVTYDYTPVAEPSTWALTLSGVLFLIWYQKRRQKLASLYA